MSAPSRESRVLQAVVSLVDSLMADFDIVDLLTELTGHCTQLLDAASAGLLLADSRRQLHLMAATSEATRDIELFQLQSDQGPCLDCYATGDPISVVDVQAETARWPRFVAAATDAGFVSVHAVPMRAAGTILGALGLFGTEPRDLGAADQLLAQTLAHIACVAIVQDHAPTPDNLRLRLHTVWSNRVVVEQAKGFLRERLDITVEDAFTVLRRYARTHHEHMAVVSRRLLSDRDARAEMLDAMRATSI